MKLNPEETLLARQLLDTVSAILNKPKNMQDIENRIRAQHFVFVDDYRDSPLTFIRICEHFNINIIKLRKQILQAALGEIDNFAFLVERELTDISEIKSRERMVTEAKVIASANLESLIRRKIHGRKLRENKKAKKSNRSES